MIYKVEEGHWKSSVSIRRIGSGMCLPPIHRLGSSAVIICGHLHHWPTHYIPLESICLSRVAALFPKVS